MENEDNKQRKWKNFIIVASLFIVVFLIFGSIYGYYDYRFDVNKCTNLHNSNYNFNQDVQLNAEYAQNCYYTLNHPLAQFGVIIGDMFIALLIGVLISFIPFLIWAEIIVNRDENYYNSYYY